MSRKRTPYSIRKKFYLEVYTAMLEYQDREGFSLSTRELAKLFDRKAQSNLHTIVIRRLQRAGLVQVKGRQIRAFKKPRQGADKTAIQEFKEWLYDDNSDPNNFWMFWDAVEQENEQLRKEIEIRQSISDMNVGAFEKLEEEVIERGKKIEELERDLKYWMEKT